VRYLLPILPIAKFATKNKIENRWLNIEARMDESLQVAIQSQPTLGDDDGDRCLQPFL
jgi:hypothetical protein